MIALGGSCIESSSFFSSVGGRGSGHGGVGIPIETSSMHRIAPMWRKG